MRQRLATGWLVPVAFAVALLHFGQEVLKPITLAAMLALVIAPLVRGLRRLGLGRATAAISSVVLVGCAALAAVAVLALQLAAVAGDLPKYRAGIYAKVEQAREFAVQPIEKLRSDLAIVVPQLGGGDALHQGAADSRMPLGGRSAVARTPDDASADPSRMLRYLWSAMADCGIVLVLLVFILLEQDVLRDRLLRLAGDEELAVTLQALADTASGISRFFLAQAVVNLCFGAVVAIALWVIGIPHAALFGALAGAMRFIPYVGILASGALIALFAAAVDPAWTQVLAAVAVVIAVELVVTYAVEPHLYGHSSGLAPVAIIVSALFWGAVWGPVGLVLSTPLTLCLVVAGRHVRALRPVAILFGDSPDSTLSRRLYQRALASELREMQDEARAWLRRRSFASYCDDILLPAASLAGADHQAGRLHEPQLRALRQSMIGLVESLTGGQGEPRARRRRPPATLENANVGAHLRLAREARLGRWQGPEHPLAGSVVLCASLARERDEFAAELLVRALSDLHIDARSTTVPRQPDPRESESQLAQLISTVFVTYPEADALAQWREACKELRARLPRAILATIRLHSENGSPDEQLVRADVDLVLHSFSEAVALVHEGAANHHTA